MSKVHAEAEESFDAAYQKTEDRYGTPYQELQNYFKNRPSRGAVLDVGSGQGRDALYLASIGYDVTAVDVSEVGVKQMLRKAEQHNLHIEGLVGNVLEVAVGETYDVVLFDMLLHSFTQSQQEHILAKYAAKLKPEGILCMVFPDDLETDYFMSILKDQSYNWELQDQVVVNDVPKLKGEDGDYTFMMIVAQRME